MSFHLMFVRIILVRFVVLNGHLFGNDLPTRLTICSHSILTICNFSYFPFCFRGRVFGFNCTSSLSLHTFL